MECLKFLYDYSVEAGYSTTIFFTESVTPVPATYHRGLKFRTVAKDTPVAARGRGYAGSADERPDVSSPASEVKPAVGCRSGWAFGRTRRETASGRQSNS